ncbi:hypothetical protein [Clostridium beijerinckii]|uniref:hypothetical protein n=1 Tax=Clostridium beijerinckii TaxID=1520 RepID=UPI001F60094F|nr:hypothetical protein [Clostridium beijerinckii]
MVLAKLDAEPIKSPSEGMILSIIEPPTLKKVSVTPLTSSFISGILFLNQFAKSFKRGNAASEIGINTLV